MNYITDYVATLISSITNIDKEIIINKHLDFNSKFCDVATNVAFLSDSKIEKAEEIASLLNKDDLIESATAANNGFVNIELSKELYKKYIINLAKNKFNFKKIDKKETIEYTDPNPFKEFHIGHLMTNTIGEAYSRVSEELGVKVKRINYQGDVGLHIAKAIYGLMVKNVMVSEIDVSVLAESYILGAHLYDENKKEIEQINLSIYKKDNSKINELYDVGKKISLEYFESIYKILGTKFNKYIFESETSKKGILIVKDALKKGIFVSDKGAVIYKGEEDGLHTRVFINTAGLPTYETKDIGLFDIKQKLFPGYAITIITANEQKDYMDVVYSAYKKIKQQEYDFTHIPHGILKLKGGKMSSREGGVISFFYLLKEIKNKIKETNKNLNEGIIEKIAVASVKFWILKQSSGKDIVFEIDTATSFEGDTGAYILYSIVRAEKILAASKLSTKKGFYFEKDIVKELQKLDFVLENSYNIKSSHPVAQHALNLAHKWNSFYAKEKILGTSQEQEKLVLVSAVYNVLNKCIDVLGIQKVSQM